MKSISALHLALKELIVLFHAVNSGNIPTRNPFTYAPLVQANLALSGMRFECGFDLEPAIDEMTACKAKLPVLVHKPRSTPLGLEIDPSWTPLEKAARELIAARDEGDTVLMDQLLGELELLLRTIER